MTTTVQITNAQLVGTLGAALSTLNAAAGPLAAGEVEFAPLNQYNPLPVPPIPPNLPPLPIGLNLQFGLNLVQMDQLFRIYISNLPVWNSPTTTLPPYTVSVVAQGVSISWA